MKDYAKQLIKENTIFDTISRQEEVFWLNDKCLPSDMIDGCVSWWYPIKTFRMPKRALAALHHL